MPSRALRVCLQKGLKPQQPRRTDKRLPTNSSNVGTSTGPSGEAYSSLRGWRPIPPALQVPFLKCFGTGDLPPSTAGTNSPNEVVSIGKKEFSVKRKNAIIWHCPPRPGRTTDLTPITPPRPLPLPPRGPPTTTSRQPYADDKLLLVS